MKIALAMMLICFLSPPAPAQKWAPLVGEWRVDVSIGLIRNTIAIRTDGTGIRGRGTCQMTVSDGSSRKYILPAAWDNVDPSRVRISGEVVLYHKGGKAKEGTLILLLHPMTKSEGTALFIDDELKVEQGTFKMTRTKGPLEVLESSEPETP